MAGTHSWKYLDLHSSEVKDDEVAEAEIDSFTASNPVGSRTGGSSGVKFYSRLNPSFAKTEEIALMWRRVTSNVE